MASEKPVGTADIGVTGLAVMGSNLARNFARHGYKVAVHNRSYAKTEKLVAERPILGWGPANSWSAFLSSGSPAQVEQARGGSIEPEDLELAVQHHDAVLLAERHEGIGRAPEHGAPPLALHGPVAGVVLHDRGPAYSILHAVDRRDGQWHGGTAAHESPRSRMGFLLAGRPGRTPHVVRAGGGGPGRQRQGHGREG